MLVTKSAVATDAGISLQLRNMSGEQLEFKKLEVGSGQYGQDEATAEALRKRTTLKAKKQQFGISSIDVSSDKTTLILSSMITNTDLKEGYTIRELGLYARIKDQPDTECLVSVSLAEIEDEIPPYNSDPESRILMKYQFAVSDSDTVSLSYEHDPVALVEDVDAKVARLLEKTKTIQSELENVKKELLGVVKQTAIVNNNTTTEAGFALDARQANPNIEGTMAANILQLNNDLSDINGRMAINKYYTISEEGGHIEIDSIGFGIIIVNRENDFGLYIYNKPYAIFVYTIVDFPGISFDIKSDAIVVKNIPKYTTIKVLQ